MNNYLFPEQMLSLSEKMRIKDGEKVPHWFRSNRDYFVNETIFNTDEKEFMQKLYDIADEVIAESDYKKTINPYNSDKEEFSSTPATLRNYSIIKPVLERFLGERRKRPNRFEVVPVGADVHNEVREQMQKEFRDRLTQNFLLILQANGTDLNSKEGQELMSTKMQDIERDTLSKYLENKAISGQQALEILDKDLRLADAFQEAYYDYLVTGSVFDFKTVNHNDVKYSIVSPMEIDIIGWDETSRFAEDSAGAVRVMYWSAASVIDNWREKLSEDDIRWVQSLEHDYDTVANARGGYTRYGKSGTVWRNRNGVSQRFEEGVVPVEHVVWKSLTKRGVLKYMTPIGEAEMPVDDTYQLNPANGDISIKWGWENEWFETFSICRNRFSRFDDNVLFLDYGVGEVQRTDINNTSKCKHPYNGIRRGYRTKRIISPVKTGMVYEELINTLHYRFDLALSRSYDKLMLFPLSLVPKDKGWTTDQWMYSIRSFSIVFFDDTEDKALQAMNAIKEIDMSLGTYMQSMWSLIQTVKYEYWESVGFNPQRFGDIGQNAGKGTTEQSISQAATSTSDMIALFEGFRETSLNALLDYSKFAWIEGKRGAYLNSDASVVTYHIDGLEHAGTQHGVFVIDPIKEEGKIEFFKNMVLQPMAQNGAAPDIMAAIVDTDNFTKIKQLAEKARNIEQQFQQEQLASQQQADQQLEAMRQQTEKLKSDTQIQVAMIRAAAEKEKALITADSFNAALGDAEGDGIAESDEIVQRSLERTNQMREQAGKQRDLRLKNNSENRKENMQMKKMENDLRIAKMNKN